MIYTFTWGRATFHCLTAPYALLVKAFGDDGLTAPRDDYKQMAQWDLDAPGGGVEVYDYKQGTCYDPSGQELKAITTWHVQGTGGGITHMLRLLDAAGMES